jgi:hypothetical protein
LPHVVPQSLERVAQARFTHSRIPCMLIPWRWSRSSISRGIFFSLTRQDSNPDFIRRFENACTDTQYFARWVRESPSKAADLAAGIF